MGHNDQSLKPKTYPIPLITPYGNYYRSIIPDAAYICLDKITGFWNPYEFTPDMNNIVTNLLFMNGRPIKMSTRVNYPTAPKEYTSSMTLLLTTSIGSSLVHTTQNAILVPGEQIDGVTVTGSVPVQGYLTMMTIVPQLEHEGETAYAELDALSESGVLAGPLTWTDLNLDNGSLSRRNPCMLLETDYTQEMRDAGDQFTFSFSPLPGLVLSEIWEICGLFQEVGMVPPA